MEAIFNSIEAFFKTNKVALTDQENEFYKAYFEGVSNQDVGELTPKDLFSIAQKQWLSAQTLADDYKVELHTVSCEDNECQEYYVVQITTRDFQYLMRSIRLSLRRAKLNIRLILNLSCSHVIRDKSGTMKEFSSKQKSSQKESFYSFILEKNNASDSSNDIITQVDRTFADLIAVNTDWKPIQNKLKHVSEKIENDTSLLKIEKNDMIKLITWVHDHYNLFGYRAFQYEKKADKFIRIPIKEEVLGVLKKKHKSIIRSYKPNEVVQKPEMNMYKTQTKSTLHSDVYTNIIAFSFTENNIVYEYQFLGLFPSDAYNSDPLSIPWLKRKINSIHTLSGFESSHYATKAIAKIIRLLPRDELFLADERELYRLVMGVFRHQGRNTVEVFSRCDAFSHTLCCFVLMPIDDFSLKLQKILQRFFSNKFDATDVISQLIVTDLDQALIYYQVLLKECNKAEINIEVEGEIQELCNGWNENFKLYLLRNFGYRQGYALYESYSQLFPSRYQSLHTVHEAIEDIKNLESLSNDNSVIARLVVQDNGEVVFKIYHQMSATSCSRLSEITSILSTMGISTLSEVSHQIKSENVDRYIRVLRIDQDEAVVEKVKQHTSVVEEMFELVFEKKYTSDSLNKLAVLCGFSYAEVDLFRAYCEFIFQQNINSFSITAYHDALLDNLVIAGDCLKLFNQMHKLVPDESGHDKLVQSILEQIDLVQQLSQDKILRTILKCIKSTVRTNYFISKRDVLVLKFHHLKLSGMIEPRPIYETFVYHHEFIAIHLRMSAKARGGIRWSDQNEGLREEIHALMTAQAVKNSVIVPDGAKGGFYIRLPVVNYSDVQRCYRLFIQGMLSITDNLINDKVVQPDHVKCLDNIDTYLVVAADRGTANLSDEANSIAGENQFWLADAFASGGEHGYNHKTMAITARTAWNSTVWHFKSIGVDLDKETITVIGIGDMSGDVFGNGMLLSKNIKLVAAFNHKHIFIDPSPDHLRSYKERLRLFDAALGWDAYSTELLSSGGAIYERSKKQFNLSDEACVLLNLPVGTAIEPDDLIRSILKANVDLLYNGGIGTYIKATTETNHEVGDKNNVSLRINADELRVKVVGEGGNLGLTQAARIEYNLLGGLVNADFVDNLGGVDCSDKEVNIKILFNTMIANGKMTLDERNKYMLNLKPEIIEMVVKDNENQNISISLTTYRIGQYYSLFMRYIESEVDSNKLDLETNRLPNHKVIEDRLQRGLSFARPEIAILIAHAKKQIKSVLMTSDLLEKDIAKPFLYCAFPQSMVADYGQSIDSHYLKHDIISTEISNQFVFDTGVAFMMQMKDELGKNDEEIIAAYMLAREVLNIAKFMKIIQDNKSKFKTDDLIYLNSRIRTELRQTIRWLLLSTKSAIASRHSIKEYSDCVGFLGQKMGHLQIINKWKAYRDLSDRLSESELSDGLFAEIMSFFAITRSAEMALDIIEFGYDIDQYLDCFCELDRFMGTHLFVSAVKDYSVHGRWGNYACNALLDKMSAIRCSLISRSLLFLSRNGNTLLSLSKQIMRNQELVSKLEKWQAELVDFKETGNYATDILDAHLLKLELMTRDCI